MCTPKPSPNVPTLENSPESYSSVVGQQNSGTDKLTFPEGMGGAKSKSTAVSPSPTRNGRRGPLLRDAEGWRPSGHTC
jgi:hypothetical protein